VKRSSTLLSDPISGATSIDGSKIIRLAQGDALTILSDDPIWACVDPVDRDLKAIADGTNVCRFPPVGSLTGMELPSECDIEDPRAIANLWLALLSDASNLRAADPVKTRAPIPVLVNEQQLAPTDFRFVLDATTKRVSLIFSAAATPPTGARVRVKWRRAPWTQSIGGSLVLSPQPHETFKSAWISNADWTIDPVQVAIVNRLGESLSPEMAYAIPQSIRDDYPELEQLMRDFFEHASAEGMPFDVLRRVTDARDIDLATDEEIARIFAELLPDFPIDALADHRLQAKLSSVFQEARGTLPSFAFAARAIHNADAKPVSPEPRMFRASDADWRQTEKMRVSHLRQALTERPSIAPRVQGIFRTADPAAFPDATSLSMLPGNIVKGIDSGSTAFVEAIATLVFGGLTVTELTLSSRRGEFNPDEILVSVTGGDSIFCCAGTIIVGFSLKTVLNPIIRPAVGDFFNFPTLMAPRTALVSRAGLTLGVEIIEPGWLVPAGATVNLRSLVSGNSYVDGAVYDVLVSTVAQNRGSWRQNASATSNGWIQTQDGRRLQAFAYEIQSSSERVLEAGSVKRALHTAGYVSFTALVETPSIVTWAQSTKSVQRTLDDQVGSIAIGEVNAGDIVTVWENSARVYDPDWSYGGVGLDGVKGKQTFVKVAQKPVAPLVGKVFKTSTANRATSSGQQSVESFDIEGSPIFTTLVTTPGFGGPSAFGVPYMIWLVLVARLDPGTNKSYVLVDDTRENRRSAIVGTIWTQGSNSARVGGVWITASGKIWIALEAISGFVSPIYTMTRTLT
jgi:hypothetical protein